MGEREGYGSEVSKSIEERDDEDADEDVEEDENERRVGLGTRMEGSPNEKK